MSRYSASLGSQSQQFVRLERLLVSASTSSYIASVFKVSPQAKMLLVAAFFRNSANTLPFFCWFPLGPVSAVNMHQEFYTGITLVTILVSRDCLCC